MDDENVNRTACLVRMVVFIVGVCAAVVAMVAVTLYSRRALKEALEVRRSFFIRQHHTSRGTWTRGHIHVLLGIIALRSQWVVFVS